MTKYKDLKNLPLAEREKKLEDLKLDLIKGRVTASKGGKVKIREIKRTIAKLIMLNKLENKS